MDAQRKILWNRDLPEPSPEEYVAKQPEINRPIKAPLWLNPFWCAIVLVMSIYLCAAIFAHDTLLEFGQKSDNLSLESTLLGASSLIAIGIGAAPTALRQRASSETTAFSLVRLNQVLLYLGLFVLICFISLLIPIAMNPGLLIQIAVGRNLDSISEAKKALGLIPGLTSFTHAYSVFFSLYGYAVATEAKKNIWTSIRVLFVVLAFLVTLTSFIGSERLILVQAAACYFIPAVLFKWGHGPLRNTLPLVGGSAVFALFAFAEYFRSWKFYSGYGQTYMSFAVSRFMAYFTTAINNGAGYRDAHDPFYSPAGTIQGVYDLASTFGYTENPWRMGLMTYLDFDGTREFNNPGGLFVPYIDYGILGGILAFVILGLVLSLLYSSFLQRRPMGILLFPLAYIGVLHLLLIFPWGEGYFIRAAITAVIVSFFLRDGRASRVKAADDGVPLALANTVKVGYSTNK